MYERDDKTPVVKIVPLLPHPWAVHASRKWCTPDIQKAIELGYTLIKMHEVHHFPPEQREVGLFANYVNSWLKIKQESAAYRAWVVTPEDKACFICQYQQIKAVSDPEESRMQSHGLTYP